MVSPEFGLYRKRFGKDRPDDIRPLEQIIDDRKREKAEREARKEHETKSAPQEIPVHAAEFGTDRW